MPALLVALGLALGLGLGSGLTAPQARAQEAHAQPVRAQDLPAPTGPVLLTVTGKIARTNQNDAALFDEAMLLALPRHRIETTTPWTDGRKVFEGVRLEDVLDQVGAGAAVTLKARALNDYSIDIPASDAREFDMLLALRMDGKPLSRRDKGPIWIVYPRDSVPRIQDERYDSRWVWQLNGLDIR
ncbi:molybdopterin-dependent oxidoreductase [Ancylobacter amanitiformis]|uniref:Oxidoreductase molybdopterin-binding domain-containing protein n=1 Tax=Ancylobacter amanitiformis TaxID=217069 RepID=A0ABU0LLW3_9HYPH|nr:molybdopterin-dependent oxidoreductase [Ancylobacter amanitiformis]MDQ0509608.1 hypothetical protein [Ancylobacter amanitiformis]